MLLPLHDRNPVVHIRFQAVTCLIIAACVLTFLWEIAVSGTLEGDVALYRLAFVPARLFGLEDGSVPPDVPWGLGSIVTSMFLHASFWHLAGNMLFLWVYGDNVEDATGHIRFVLFYLICGAVAALAQAITNIHDVNPMIGASGAISGVLGAYLVLHPRVRILVMTFFFVTFKLRAMWLLGLWIGYQVVLALLDDGSAGVAWWAHIGGFAAGALLIPVFRRAGVVLFDREDFEPKGTLGKKGAVSSLGLGATIYGVIIGALWFIGVLSLPLALLIFGIGTYLWFNHPSDPGSDDEARGRDHVDSISQAVANYEEETAKWGTTAQAPLPGGRRPRSSVPTVRRRPRW